MIVIGLGRYGSAIAEGFIHHNLRVLMIDFNGKEVRQWRASGFEAMYGDVRDSEFISTLPLDGVEAVIAALGPHTPGLTHEDPRLILIDSLSNRQFKGCIAVAANRTDEAESLKAAGTDLVLLPLGDAAKEAVDRLLNATSNAREVVREDT